MVSGSNSSQQFEADNGCSLSLGRVALLGIAQRRISIKITSKPTKRRWAKPLPVTIKTFGNWLQAQLQKTNLSPYYLAKKLGIPTRLVRSWSDGTCQPNSQQLEVLTKFLGIAPPEENVFAIPICPHEPEK
jgi:ribosome-binding protein aMBF1 (putative translation factor)